MLERGGIWFSIEDNFLTIGVSDSSLYQIGDISEVNLPDVGESILRDDILISLIGQDSDEDFVSPANGLVSEINQVILDDPKTINEDPTGDGWIIRLKLDQQSIIELGNINAPN